MEASETCRQKIPGGDVDNSRVSGQMRINNLAEVIFHIQSAPVLIEAVEENSVNMGATTQLIDGSDPCKCFPS